MITILAIGSRGDVQPYIALGAALIRAGKKVRIATFDAFKALAEGAGMEFYQVKGDITAIASNVKRDSTMRGESPLKAIQSFGKLKDYATEVQGDLYDAMFTASEDAEAVIYHPGCVIGHFAAQHLGIPSLLASPYPMYPTKQYSSLVFYGRVHLGSGFNILSHKMFQRMMWMTGGMPVKQFWMKRFGKAPENYKNIFAHLADSPTPVLISGSPSIFPTPENCPDNIHTTGYWFYDEEQAWKPAAELTAFLEAGSKPIYIGFGSMGNPDEAAETRRIMLEAAEKTGQRAVLAAGWSGMQTEGSLPENIFMLESAPHSWLFPRMSAVVHHGGAGTAAAGFRAGVPSVIVPHGMDQYAWGYRAYELGVGTKPINRSKLTSDNLANAIQQVLQPAVMEKAAALGEAIRSEGGADLAAQIIIQAIE